MPTLTLIGAKVLPSLLADIARLVVYAQPLTSGARCLGFILGLGLGLARCLRFVLGLGLCLCFILRLGFILGLGLALRLRLRPAWNSRIP